MLIFLCSFFFLFYNFRRFVLYTNGKSVQINLKTKRFVYSLKTKYDSTVRYDF